MKLKSPTDWDHLDLSTEEKAQAFASWMEEGARKAVKKALAETEELQRRKARTVTPAK